MKTEKKRTNYEIYAFILCKKKMNMKASNIFVEDMLKTGYWGKIVGLKFGPNMYVGNTRIWV